MTALLWSGSCLLSALLGAWIALALQRALPRNRVPEPVHVDSEAQIVVRYRTAEGA